MLIVFYAVIPVVLGTVLAATMMRARRMRGLGFFRVVVFVPQVVADGRRRRRLAADLRPDGPLN